LIFAIVLLVQLVAGNIGAIVDAAPEYQEKLQGLFVTLSVTAEKWLGAPLTIAELNSRVDIQFVLVRLVGALQAIAGDAFQIFLYVAFLLLEGSTLDKKINAFASTPERERAIKQTLKSIGRGRISGGSELGPVCLALDYGSLAAGPGQRPNHRRQRHRTESYRHIAQSEPGDHCACPVRVGRDLGRNRDDPECSDHGDCHDYSGPVPTYTPARGVDVAKW
jgi:hypothetical protein